MSRFDNMQARALTLTRRAAKGRIMTRTPLILALGVAAALAGCHKENHTIIAGPDGADNDANIVANGPIELPPTVTASKIYRCADNQIVYVDWLSDNKSANVRTDKSGMPTQVTSTEAGQPMSGSGGYALSGTATASTVKIAIPGHPSQSCKA
jgi:hypothetical protein